MVFILDLLPTKSEGASRLRPTFVLPPNSFSEDFLGDIGNFVYFCLELLNIIISFNMKGS